MVDVSVLTPSLGYGRFIADNILSVSGQEGVTVQHVVQDAGSSDETVTVLKEFDDIVDWTSEPDTGQSDALNKAFARARGRWVAWLNADEFYLPWGLAALVQHGDASGADVVYGDNVFVDDVGRLQRLLPRHGFQRSVLWYGCFISSSSTIFRRSALPSVPWNPQFRRIMDWELYLNLATRGAGFAYRRFPVGAFRAHQDQVTASSSREFWDEYTSLFDRYGITRWTRRRGLAIHRAYKLVNGSYWRQFQAKRYEGNDTRWFGSDEAQLEVEQFLRTCYGKQSLPAADT